VDGGRVTLDVWRLVLWGRECSKGQGRKRFGVPWEQCNFDWVEPACTTKKLPRMGPSPKHTYQPQHYQTIVTSPMEQHSRARE
jgi:hypothetical protein